MKSAPYTVYTVATDLRGKAQHNFHLNFSFNLLFYFKYKNEHLSG